MYNILNQSQYAKKIHIKHSIILQLDSKKSRVALAKTIPIKLSLIPN